MWAILSVNLRENFIGADQAKVLVNIFNDHPTIKSLCGNKGDETELDMSGKMNGADDAIMLAAEIVGGLGLEHGRAILEVLARERGELHMTDAETGQMCADAAVSMMNSAS